MRAYVIVDVDITDPVKYEDYKKLTPGSLVPFEGKFIVRGGRNETLEGSWQPGRIVVLEFPLKIRRVSAARCVTAILISHLRQMVLLSI